MAPDNDLAGMASGNNSSDFVRKLYKMLEDPAYSSVVRWGNEGDSFVVLENEKFTKTILPKHFKHSNFASFVRQLNKYDFHKVRQNEENGQSPYGPQAWEFKHPEFRADSKHNLDNIRRKAPAPRKQQPTEDAFPASQQVALLSDTLSATQHQVQQLQEQYFGLTHSNKVLVEEIMSLKKMLAAQNQVQNELLTYLNSVDERRRSTKHTPHPAHSRDSSHSTTTANHNGGFGVLPDGNDEPSQELRRAREIMNGIEPDTMADRELHRLSVAYQTNGSPPDSASSSINVYSQPNSAAGLAPTLLHDPFSDPRHLVYPVGQTVGIDPFHADNVNSLPFNLNHGIAGPNEAAPQITTTPPIAKDSGSPWLGRKPRILLVEDDKTCSKIGSKFLSQIECLVETARDGEEATTIVTSDPDRFDLIFMDIIMPKCDGITATHYIRGMSLNVPIVAMTSNIRQEDLAMYYEYGMNDVLAKPFTKDGMIRILRKHLAHMLKPTSGQNSHALEPGAPITASSAPYAMPMGAVVKFEAGTPTQSPAATTGSWHSPSQQQMHQTSPTIGSAAYSVGHAGTAPMVLTPGGMHRPQAYQSAIGSPMSRVPEGLGMGDDRPEKRQRIYGPGQGAAFGQ